MPRLGQKKVITLKTVVSFTYYDKIEVNPSIRLTDVQRLVDQKVKEMKEVSPGCTVEVTAEGLV